MEVLGHLWISVTMDGRTPSEHDFRLVGADGLEPPTSSL
jgi:hypothetical protein